MNRRKDTVYKTIQISRESINPPVLSEVIELGLELAREGREGRKIGSMFVISDEKTTLAKSRCMILDPLAGHPPSKKNITDKNMRETIKELSQLDGAFIISDDGIVLSACRYIHADSSGVEVPLGLGSRHIAAAAITLAADCAAVVVSESSVVRVFYRGEVVFESAV